MIKKYFASFETEALYNAFKVSETFVKPNVSLVDNLGQLFFTKSDPFLTINGVKYAGDKVITLAAGNSYVIKGYHEGQIIIDAETSKPTDNTHIRLDGVTIISDEAYGIMYQTPEENQGYKDLVVTIEKDSENFVVCNKANATAEDATYAAVDSWNNLTIQGVGYLSVYNNVGHGIRGTELKLAGVHLYADTQHDAVHGKYIYIEDGSYYIAKAKDGFGTTDNGSIYVLGGEFYEGTLTDDMFDSKQQGYYLNVSLVNEFNPNNMIALENKFVEGTVTAYPTSADYKAGTNGVTIESTTSTIYEEIYYNADLEGHVIANQSATGYTTLVRSKDSTSGDDIVLVTEQPMYIISEEYNVVSITGKITAPIVRPMSAITMINPTFSSKGKLKGGYDNNFDVYLNGAAISTSGNCPSIVNLPDVGRVKVVAVKDTINMVVNKDIAGDGDHDAIKSENNVSVEVKNNSHLIVTSVLGDGVDGGETTFTDSKGVFIATQCGERGVKGNAIVIGPAAQIDTSVITSYITDTTNEKYTTFDGIFISKHNVTGLNKTVGNADTTSEETAKASGFADVYGRNGKCTKGVFGTTDTELKGVAIIGSLTAFVSVDTGNAKNLYVNQILKAPINGITTVNETYKAVPYQANPIV